MHTHNTLYSFTLKRRACVLFFLTVHYIGYTWSAALTTNWATYPGGKSNTCLRAESSAKECVVARFKQTHTHFHPSKQNNFICVVRTSDWYFRWLLFMYRPYDGWTWGFLSSKAVSCFHFLARRKMEKWEIFQRCWRVPIQWWICDIEWII